MSKKPLCILLCVGMLLSLSLLAVAEEPTIQAGGWNETLWAQIPGLRDDQVTAVSYKGPISGNLTGQDLQYLVRNGKNGVRIDIPGLPAGNYCLTVATTSGMWTCDNIKVEAQDRSGYAHFGDTQGVGAYTNSGELKENAIVLYVTEENKNTVTVTSKDGTKVTGIGNILNSVGQEASGGKNSKGGIANTNQDIIRKLAADGTPLVVRIIGNVTAPEGLTAFDSVDYGGSKGDNGFMARMSGGKNITVEGIGEGAGLDGWGLHFICQTSDYAAGNGRSFEVRNLSFRNVPEDCVGMEGQQDGSNLTAPVERCWIHHCAFYAPKIANPAESDKDGGDGACDFKRGRYFTNSYCFYNGYHKTNLVGGSDSNKQYHMTYHHNYWKNCESRGPLARQANIHMYNNIFEGQTSYCMNPRANAYIFSEYNLFLNCKNPVTVKSGAVKSYQDSFINCTKDNHATIVSDKTQKVSSGCLYENFDTDPTLSYIPGGNYLLHADIQQMQQIVAAQAGPLNGGATAAPEVPTQPDDPGSDVILPPGSYVHDFTASGKESTFFTIDGNLSTSKGSITFEGSVLTTCLKIESSTSITFHAPEKGVLVLIFGNAAGKTIKIDGVKQPIGNDSVLKLEVLAGKHTITKGDSINLFYMAYVSDSVGQTHSHSYTETVNTPASCIQEGLMTYTCQCGDSYTVPIPKTAHDYRVEVVASTCTEGGYILHICDCGQQYTDGQTGKLGHTEQVQPAKAATCETAGLTEGIICQVCGEILQAQQMVPALEHSFGTDGRCLSCGKLDPGYAEPVPTAPEETTPTQPQATTPVPTQPGTEDPQKPQPVGMGWLWVVIGLVIAGAVVALLLFKKKK